MGGKKWPFKLGRICPGLIQLTRPQPAIGHAEPSPPSGALEGPMAIGARGFEAQVVIPPDVRGPDAR